MPASTDHFAPNARVLYTLSKPWTDTPHEQATSPQTPVSNAASPSCASSHTLGRNSPYSRHPTRSPSFCPETPTLSQHYRLQSPTPPPTISPPDGSSPTYSPDTPSLAARNPYAASPDVALHPSWPLRTQPLPPPPGLPAPPHLTTFEGACALRLSLFAARHNVPGPAAAQYALFPNHQHHHPHHQHHYHHKQHHQQLLNPYNSPPPPGAAAASTTLPAACRAPSPRPGVLYISAGPAPEVMCPVPLRDVQASIKRWGGLVGQGESWGVDGDGDGVLSKGDE